MLMYEEPNSVKTEAHRNPAPKNLSDRPIRLPLALILLGAGFLAGCGGGPSPQVLTAQALSQRQASNANQELQNQLMAQAASRSSLTSYKDYKVGPEDQLAIVIYGQEKLNQELQVNGQGMRVNGQGEITLPLVGVVKVADLTPQEIEKQLVKLYDADYLVNPRISVQVKEFHHQRVAVTGAVDKPGSYEIIGPRTLLEVLAQAGGLSTKNGTPPGDAVNVIRHQNAPDVARTAKAGRTSQPFAPKTETTVINLRRLLSGQAPDLNLTVRSGDVIHVPFAGNAFVLGAVKRPGNVAVKDALTVSQAVSMAGGIDPVLGNNHITIMRFDEQGKPLNINTNLKSIMSRKDPDIPVKDSDVILVNESTIKKKIYVIRSLLPIPSGAYSLGAI